MNDEIEVLRAALKRAEAAGDRRGASRGAMALSAALMVREAVATVAIVKDQPRLPLDDHAEAGPRNQTVGLTRF